MFDFNHIFWNSSWTGKLRKALIWKDRHRCDVGISYSENCKYTLYVEYQQNTLDKRFTRDLVTNHVRYIQLKDLIRLSTTESQLERELLKQNLKISSMSSGLGICLLVFSSLFSWKTRCATENQEKLLIILKNY